MIQAVLRDHRTFKADTLCLMQALFQIGYAAHFTAKADLANGNQLIADGPVQQRFWKESGNFEKYCKERMKNARKLARSRRHKDYFNECWDYVEFCGERLNLSVSYEKQKDYIKNLYKNEDYMTLERVFRPYFKMMQKSLQKNELFAEDEEIFDIYVDVLEKTGKTVQRSKIGTLI